MDTSFTDILDNIPGGFSQRISYLIDSETRKDYKQLNALRGELERFIKHLAVLGNISEEDWRSQNSVKNKIQVLAGNKVGILKEGMEHYLTFWYGLGCVGSHSKGISEERYISSKKHVDMCVQAMSTVFLWYIQEYPPLSQKESFIQRSIEALETFNPVSSNSFVNPSNKNISEILKQNDLAVIHGPSWVGKTSLSCFAISELTNERYLPIIFHERNLVSPSLLFEEASGSHRADIQRVALRDKAGTLHKEIVTSIFRGDSCAILFDDPFGHRYFRPHSSPLSYLRISDWIKLADKDTSLGSIKIIVNTPTKFWNAAIEALTDRTLSPIFKENIEWIRNASNNRSTIQKLSLKDYCPEDLVSVIKNAGLSFNCKWADNLEICDLISGSIQESCDSFDTLRLFCLATKNSTNEDYLVESAEKYFEKSIELGCQISNLEDRLRRFLIVVYIGEAFEQLSRDYLYSKSNFSGLCKHLRMSPDFLDFIVREDTLSELNYWVSFDSDFAENRSSFPRFRHPDIRTSVEVFVREAKGKETVSNLILNSDFVACFSESTASIMRWESIYVLCYFAFFLDQQTCQLIHDEWLSVRKTEFDYSHTLWSISDNWISIKDSSLEAFAIVVLQRICREFHSSRRDYIWEIVNNWAHMPEKLRLSVLWLNASEEKVNLKPIVVDWHLISFLGAVFCNYQTISSFASLSNSKATKLCLDFVNDLVREISQAKNLKTPQYKSYEDDRVFNNRGANYSGREVLLRVSKLGLDFGGVTEKEQIIRNINLSLS